MTLAEILASAVAHSHKRQQKAQFSDGNSPLYLLSWWDVSVKQCTVIPITFSRWSAGSRSSLSLLTALPSLSSGDQEGII